MNKTIWIFIAIAVINVIIKYYAKKSAASKKLDQRPIHLPIQTPNQTLDPTLEPTLEPTPELKVQSSAVNPTWEQLFPTLARFTRAIEQVQDKGELKFAPATVVPEDSFSHNSKPSIDPSERSLVEPAKPTPQDTPSVGAKKQSGAVDLLLNKRQSQSILKAKPAFRTPTNKLVWDASSVRQGFIMSEILSKPVSLRT